MLIKDLKEDDVVIDYEIFEKEEEQYQIWLDQKALYVRELGIKVRSGYYEVWNEENEEYDIDFDFYMFFDATTNEHYNDTKN